MTTDRERILELLRELAEAHPGLRVAQIVSAASDRGGAGGMFYAEDRQLVYGLLALKKETGA